MLNENIKSELFFEISDEQQQIVAGGGPTLGIVADIARHTVDFSPVFSTATAGPQGASTTGFANPQQIDSLAAQTVLGATGGGVGVPEGLAFPTAVV